MKFSLQELQNHPIIFQSNFGDDAIALIQWLSKASIKNVKIVYIDTGWSASFWPQRIKECETYIKSLGFEWIKLQSIVNFREAVLGRNAFPTEKFSWCSALLKGLVFNDWLDQIDDQCEAIITLPKRKSAIHSELSLEEWIAHSPHHQDRTVWHPILNISELERDHLIERAGFTRLNHRSLECQPCVYSNDFDLAHLAKEDIEKVASLEADLGCSFFNSESLTKENNIYHIVEVKNKMKIDKNSDYLSKFYLGCGNHFGCGL